MWPKVYQWLDNKHPTLSGHIGRIHPILPNSRTRYNLEFGGKLVVAKGKGWSLAIERTISVSGEKKTLGKLEVLNW